jgi:hypothetical protein
MIVYLVNGDEGTYVATQSQAFSLAQKQSVEETFPVDVIRLTINTHRENILRILNKEGSYVSAENVLRSYHRGRKTRTPPRPKCNI